MKNKKSINSKTEMSEEEIDAEMIDKDLSASKFPKL